LRLDQCLQRIQLGIGGVLRAGHVIDHRVASRLGGLGPSVQQLLGALEACGVEQRAQQLGSFVRGGVQHLLEATLGEQHHLLELGGGQADQVGADAIGLGPPVRHWLPSAGRPPVQLDRLLLGGAAGAPQLWSFLFRLTHHPIDGVVDGKGE
jgi:hypothetical protein